MSEPGVPTPDDEARLADYYNRTEDISEFDLDHPEPVQVRRNTTRPG